MAATPLMAKCKKGTPEFTTTKSGLKYRVVAPGDGATPNSESIILCHYKGWLDGGKEFDNSYTRNEPTELRMNKVIRGWAEGLQLMKVGGKFEFEIPADLGYGEKGAGGGVIPPNATLHFIVELIKVK